MLNFSVRFALPALFLIALNGCTGRYAAPVDYPAKAVGASAYASYTVQRGDTLYSIARRHGQSIENIAAWNNLRSPYILYPGQVLRVQAPISQDAVIAPSIPPKSAEEPLRRVYPGTIQSKSVSAFSADCPAPALVWQWPASGQRAESTLSSTGRVGLNIFGNLGNPVYAVADGQVVYSGPGANGYYGNLIILKHDATYLSIYAYNRTRYVKEGDYVQRGRQIAEMGRDHQNRAVLYFEISCRDKTLDPLRYLPR
jgi:lipoprotein NlpD